MRLGLHWFLLWTVLFGASADAQMMQAIVNSPNGYRGPGDIVSGATAWYGLRAYSAAYAASLGKAINLRRASDSVACDVLVASTGRLGLTSATCNSSTQGGITPAAFAGTDATATCSATASTTLACTGASSTPHALDPISGTGITQPAYIVSCGTFTGGAGSCTMNLAQTVASVTVTFQVALFVAKAYDQSGGTNDAVQATTANQPLFLSTCVGTSTNLPCLVFYNLLQVLQATITSTAFTTLTYSFVAIRTGQFTTFGGIANLGTQTVVGGFGNAANTAVIYAGTVVTSAAADNAWHAVQEAFNGASSVINVDGSSSTVNPGTVSTGLTSLQWGDTTTAPTGASTEMGMWGAVVFNSTQISNMHTNQSAYWGTP